MTARANMAATVPAAMLLAALAFGGCKGAPGSAPQRAASPAQYAAALAVADEFCQAWQKGSFPDAKALMDAGLLERHTQEKLAGAIASTTNPVHLAYEIFDGQLRADGKLAFGVRLFHRFTGQSGDRIEGPVEEIVLGQDSAGRWRVCEFPVH